MNRPRSISDGSTASLVHSVPDAEWERSLMPIRSHRSSKRKKSSEAIYDDLLRADAGA